MRKLTLAAAAVLALASGAIRADVSPKNFDLTVRPQDDFYRYVNGTYLKTTVIPPEYSSWGSHAELTKRNQDALRILCERSAVKGTSGTAIERQVGDLYASGMDVAAIEAAGAKPLQPELERIAAVKTPADVMLALAHLHNEGLGSAGFRFGSGADAKNSRVELAQLAQGGLGLPDRDYYLRPDEKSQKLRMQYVAHVSRMLGLLGDTPAAAQAAAEAIMKLETALATASVPRVKLRDPQARYHKMTVAELTALAPALDWPAYFKGVGAAPFTELNVGQPGFVQGFAAVLASTPVADWRAYLRWHLVRETAPFLSKVFVTESFEFNGRTLTGQEKLRPRWQRVVGVIDSNLGEALGQLYVAEYFPPESKARMQQLVANLRAALRERLQTLEWMDEPTRIKALAKLDAFTVKVGYPDKWRDYSGAKVDRGPYVLNVLRLSALEQRRDMAKIGQPVDRTEWGMTPPTVNAYFRPTANEIVFPAGYLQPPFFDAKADDPVNYGAIGTSIGHEMTHGFDDSGRQYDGDGNLVDWWTPESAARFKARSGGVVKQFAAYTVLDGVHVNGELTQGENIADLGGVKISYAALQKALAGKPVALIDGFTPEQRFFISYAAKWRRLSRDQAMRLQINTDPHSPAEFRANGPLSNLDEFAKAFDVPEGAPMRRPAAERVTIW
jgi:predicted metalloendopeptidase